MRRLLITCRFPSECPTIPSVGWPKSPYLNIPLTACSIRPHRTNSLLFHVDSHSPGVGSLLKTTCTLDEVCLSDQVEEIATKYPGRTLEIIIRTTQPPLVTLRQAHLYDFPLSTSLLRLVLLCYKPTSTSTVRSTTTTD
ncbi:hypothetical protein OSTOST_24596 [Ostertagia ostertagi]